MNPFGIFTWLENLPFASTIREIGNWFPWIESFHVLFVVTVVGTITVVDLRLLGWAWTNRSIKQLSTELLPFTWVAFAGAVATGALLFSSRAVKYGTLLPFQVKTVLLVLAGLNMLYFHYVTWKGVDGWDSARVPPSRVRLAGAVSLVLWMVILTMGRWTGFSAEL